MKKKTSYATSGQHTNIVKEIFDDGFSFGPDTDKDPIFVDVFWEGGRSATCPACDNDTVRILRDNNSVRLDVIGYCIKRDCRRIIVFKEVKQMGKRNRKKSRKRKLHGNPRRSRILDSLQLTLIYEKERRRFEGKSGETNKEAKEKEGSKTDA